MINKLLYFILLSLLFLAGCIEQYYTELKNIESILVVEGFITSGTTQITLSRSVSLDVNSSNDFIAVDHAFVYVACDDGTQSEVSRSSGNGTYLITTGELKMDTKYCLVIQVEDHEYWSDFLSLPYTTPSMNISFACDDNDIHVCINSYGNDTQTGYYLWSYKEDWEIYSYMYGPWVFNEIVTSWNQLRYVRVANDLNSPNNRYYCWRRDSSRFYIMGTTDHLTDNNIREKKILSFSRTNEKTSVLYRVQVTQNRIHKEGYDYYSSVQKNMFQTGSIFSHIPYEITGNIKCITNPDIPVIGYVEVSTTITDVQWLDTIFFDPSYRNSQRCGYEDLMPDPGYGATAPGQGLVLFSQEPLYVTEHCVDCTKRSGTKRKPKDWPNDHI